MSLLVGSRFKSISAWRGIVEITDMQLPAPEVIVSDVPAILSRRSAVLR